MPLHSILNEALLALIPQRCRLCETILSSRRFLCRRCRLENTIESEERCNRCYRLLPETSLSENTSSTPCRHCAIAASPLTTERFIWEYSGRAAEYLRKAKYGPDEYLFSFLCKRAAHAIANYIPSACDLWVPIPSLPSSVHRRGFSPGAAFANYLSLHIRGHRLRCRERLLLRPGARRKARIASLAPSARLREASRFEIRSLLPHERRILLIDDLVTTGASSRAAATLLRSAGAKEVHLISLMRREPYDLPPFLFASRR